MLSRLPRTYCATAAQTIKTAIAMVMAVSLWGGAAFAQGARYDSIAQTTAVVAGVTTVIPVPGASVTVCNYPATGQTGTSPCTNKASVYTDDTLTVTASNPVTADQQGNFGFWVLPGAYDYSVCTGVVCVTSYHVFLPVGVVVSNKSSSSENFEAVRQVNASTPGADWCAKVINQIATLPSTGGVINASALEGAQTCSQDPVVGVTKPVLIRLGAATVTSTVVWNINSSNVSLRGLGWNLSTLQFSPTSLQAAALKVGTSTPSTTFVQEISIQDLTISGNANVTDDLFITGTHRSSFERLALQNAAGCGLHTVFAVTDTFKNIHITNQIHPWVVQPTCGANFGQIDASHQTTDGTVTDLIAEVINGDGWTLSGANNMTFTSGTSEQNAGRGVVTCAQCLNNTFNSPDIEQNTNSDDILEAGSYDSWNATLGASTNHTLHITGNNNHFKGGEFNLIQIDSGAKANELDVSYCANETCIYTDNGIGTKARLYNITTMRLENERQTTPPGFFSGFGSADPFDMLSGSYAFIGTTPLVLTDSVVVTGKPWRALFIGAWFNNNNGGGLAQPYSIIEATSAAPTVTIGSTQVTFSVNGSGKFQGVGGNVSFNTYFAGRIFVIPNAYEAAGTQSALLQGQVNLAVPSGTVPLVFATRSAGVDPVANLTVANHEIEASCGNTSTCSPSFETNVKVYRGTVPLSAGSATVTGFSPTFSSTSSFTCMLTNESNANAMKYVRSSTSSITITGTGTDVIDYRCEGT